MNIKFALAAVLMTAVPGTLLGCSDAGSASSEEASSEETRPSGESPSTLLASENAEAMPPGIDGTEGYGECPSGRACIFRGLNGGNPLWYPLRCGMHNLHDFGVGNWAHSYKTHGNRISVYNWGSLTRTVYPAWAQGNFLQEHRGTIDELDVLC